MRNVEAGFVDEAVVLELLSGAAEPRAPKILEQLALAADDMDYAGWPPTVLTDMRLALRS